MFYDNGECDYGCELCEAKNGCHIWEEHIAEEARIDYVLTRFELEVKK